ncbi:MAG TPA: TPM domain-containing protein [Chthoniobacterales bacterium]|jgi:hypothetical protein
MSRFVRQLSLICALALPLGAVAEEIPPAPANHIYDPDFFITRELTAQLSAKLLQFQTSEDFAVYLAVYTTTPGVIGETAAELNSAWDQSGYGVVIVFVPQKGAAYVQPSPQLSLVENADHLTKVFLDAARSRIAFGDYAGAALSGTQEALKSLHETHQRLLGPPEKPWWQLSRGWLLTIFTVAVLLAVIFLRSSARAWRSANLFDHSYRFREPDEPARLRFGGMRSGGTMATITFRAPLKSKDI